jgi:predicted secreted hydrolase
MQERRHLQAEQISRQALGLAGAIQLEDATRVFLKNWSAYISSDSHLLKVKSDDFSFELTLTPVKPLVLHGLNGYSLKGSTPERASCYYSFTRLKSQGQLSIGEHQEAVEGLAWMDHEFSTAMLEPDLEGWDWFSLQLSDQTEVMAFMLRKKKGNVSPASSATLVDSSGRGMHLKREDFEVTVLDTWKSPHTDTIYPSRWRVQIFPHALDLTLVPNLADQEMRTNESTGVTYWEGSVSIRGTQKSQPVEGQGYVEMTGYSKGFDLPM